MSAPLNIDHVRALLDDELAALNKFVARGAGMLDADPADPECSVIVGLVRDAVEAHLDEDGVLEYVTMSLLKTALVLKERLEQTELKVIELEAQCRRIALPPGVDPRDF